MDIIRSLITQLDAVLGADTDTRRQEGLPGLYPLEVKVLGQMSLLMDPIGIKLNPIATRDFDAILRGDWLAIAALRSILSANGLVYDELSEEIWLPKFSTFIPYHRSPHLEVSYLDPLSTLTSKAIKAKEKNRFLIRDALTVLGEPLEQAIIHCGGDISFFFASEGEL